MSAAEPDNDVSGIGGEESQATLDIVSEESISEHITSASGSVERDRSLREIEITNPPGLEVNSPTGGGDASSREGTPDSFEQSDGVMLGGGGVKSILEEILNNEQFRSDQSFDLFANVNFDDDSLANVPGASLKDPVGDEGFKLPSGTDSEDDDKEKRIKCLEDMVAVKQTTINALNSEIESLKEWSNTFTSSMVSATEYRQLQQDCNAKLVECDTVLKHKNDMIRDLTESLEQSVKERKNLLGQVESFKSEVAELRRLLTEASETLDRRGDSQNPDDVVQLKAEVSELKKRLESDRERHDAETARLRNLLETVKCGSTELADLKTELEVKHSREVEELRTYFEKKCAELEKNYSEEVFSQQSRKMSGSSSDIELSDDLLLSNRPGPGGDANPRLLRTKEDAAKMADTLAALLEKMSGRPFDDDEQLGRMEAELRVELAALLKIGEKLEIKAIENRYLEEISNLKYQLDECHKRHAAIQEVGSSGEFDIVQSYERRLQEQIAVAKMDMVTALDAQFQRIVSDDVDDDEWPSEFRVLRDRFASKRQAELRLLKEEHARESSDLLRERDALRQQAESLRGLVSELVRYFGECEDALNDTLVEELVRHEESSSRVHLTPDFARLIGRIEEEGREDGVQDVSSGLRHELSSCLEKLRRDANAILAMTSEVRRRGGDDPDRIAVLERELESARTRLAEMIENGRNEVVSEAYGEAGRGLGADLGDATAALETLQERARSLATASNADPVLLQLIEELCQAGSRLVESAYRERCDLLQQAEHLERQLEEAGRTIGEHSRRLTELRGERDEAVDKIEYLRDIIGELEAQNDSRLGELRAQLDVAERLQRLADDQQKVIEELRGSEAERERLREHVAALEHEVRTVRELAGGGEDVKRELSDLEHELDAKTKTLELLHSSTGNSCSSPSEDMSVRDVAGRGHDDKDEVPLRQLARLKEKLIRHSRAEEAAAKRIRDLEMQLKTTRDALEEARKEINEHVVLISSLQIRLDQQRLRAEYIERQTSTSLEGKIDDLQAEIRELRERARAREQAIEQRDHLVRETRERLREANEKEDALEEALKKKEEELRAFADLGLDVDDLRALADLKKSGVPLTAIDLSRSTEKARRRDADDPSVELSPMKAPDDTVFMGCSEISAIEPVKVPYNSTEKKVHFEVDELRARLEEETRAFQQEREEAADRERRLGVELAEKTRRVAELEREAEESKRDAVRKEDACLKLARQRKDLEDDLAKFKRDSFANLDAALNAKNVAIAGLEERLRGQSDETRRLQADLDSKRESLKSAMEMFNGAMEERARLEEQLETLRPQNDELRSEVERLGALVVDKDRELEVLVEDLKRLREAVREKDRIVAQITEDHGRVHSNLKTIEAKIKETGNVLDLAARLKAEHRRSADLLVEVHGLRAKLLGYEAAVADPAPIDDVKRELERSVRIDSDILNAVGERSASSASDARDPDAYGKALARQKTRAKQLRLRSEQLEKDRAELEHRLHSLQGMLEKERAFLKQTQIEDANLIEQLRIRLDATLDAREDLERLLADERACRRSLEAQIEELKKPAASSSESATRYRALPTEDAARLSRELEAARVDLREATATRAELENNLKYTSEVLALETERNRNFEEKIRVLCEKEKALRLEALQTKFELDARTAELEERKISMDELDAEKALLERQKADLAGALRARVSHDPHPETLEKLIAELKTKTEENRKKVEYIALIESDKRALEAQLRSETRDKLDNGVEFRHLKARCDYLFAKTLKLESLRKSLIWQKRYLTDYCHAHRTRPDSDRHLNPLGRFRSAAFVVVSLARMRFLVRRWHNGVRIAEKINARHSDRSRPPAAANFQVGQPVSSQHFVGQLKVKNNAVPGPFPETNQSSGAEEASWSGLTPPSRDVRTRNRLKIGTNVLKREDVTPLKAPQLLAQFQDRLHELHEKFATSLEPE
ncbi:myosin-11-like isoform X2 [Cylas formicarius]|uniref:myosin-11-like isoform X2 n=1 Tax=Cylas formicarius TaxID=197179 RepID=UPI002958A04A|nr:myosin-11-like isoform X2 [Cylas formicarius]